VFLLENDPGLDEDDAGRLLEVVCDAHGDGIRALQASPVHLEEADYQ
jgi:hypothetical protein